MVLETFPVAQRIRDLGDKIDNAQRAAVAAANAAANKDFAVFQDNVKGLFAGHEVFPKRGRRNPDGWIYELEVFERTS